MEATGQSPSLGEPTTTGQWSAVQSHSEPHRAVRDLRHRGHSSRWGTRHPRSGVSIKMLVTLRAPYSEQQRPTVREEDAPASECAPKYQPGCEGDRAVAALSTPSGQMAGVGRGLWGLPTHTEDSDTASRAAGGPQSRGLRGARLGGAGGPSPVRTAPGRKGRFRRSRRLNITRRTLPILPF